MLSIEPSLKGPPRITYLYNYILPNFLGQLPKDFSNLTTSLYKYIIWTIRSTDPQTVYIKPGQEHAGKIKVIACATVIEEMLSHLPPGDDYSVLDFGLHVSPESLRSSLQEAIDVSAKSAETILLGYGLCSQAVVGLHANGCRLVVPKVDDCIAIFLGSAQAYKAQFRSEPGTYYLTKGWIEAGDSPFGEYDSMAERYGEEKARQLIGKMLKNYTRLALINTGQYELGRYRDYCQRAAERFGLRYEEIPGSSSMIKKLLDGPWDDEFVVANPGETITYLDFKRNRNEHADHWGEDQRYATAGSSRY
jgi:hypothetical protein